MRVRRPLLLLVCLTTALIGLVAIAPSPASATPTVGSGTVLYRKGVDIYATNGSATRRLTTDGATPSAAGKGSSGYFSPSESDGGSVVVAYRNQTLTHPGDDQRYKHGYLWVMNAYGHVIRTIDPPQFDYFDSTTCGLPANNPQGIYNAYVSPDGKHIAYSYSQKVEIYSIFSGGCSVGTSYRTTVIGIDGSNPVPVDNGTTTSTMNESLDTGMWANSTTLLVDDQDFGSVQAYYASLPNLSGTAWFAPNDDTDTAYLQPAYRKGIVATQGLSDASGSKVVRIWTTSGLGQPVSYRCERASTVDRGDSLGDPTLSPDGSQVAYEDVGDNESTSITGQGVYVMNTASCSTSLLVGGANDAFWSRAPLSPPADTTGPSVSITAPSAAAVASQSTILRWKGSDSQSGVASYQIQESRGSIGAASLSTWKNVGPLFESTDSSARVTDMTPGSTECFRIRARDAAGNVTTSSAKCFAVALDDRALTASSGWSRITGSGYYAGTASRSTTLAASLKRTGVVLDRVGIVATTCSGCGTVGVYVGSTLIGKIQLAATATHNKVVKMLPAFSSRTGTVRLKVLSSGKRVTIDGLVASHR